jgi:hypothetical protein
VRQPRKEGLKLLLMYVTGKSIERALLNCGVAVR